MIEEFLDGEEASFIVLATASAACRSRPARITSDSATATRARTPAGWARSRPRRSSRPRSARIVREIVAPTVRGLAKDGIPYRDSCTPA